MATLADIPELQAELALLQERYDSLNDQRIEAFRAGQRQLARTLQLQQAQVRGEILAIQETIRLIERRTTTVTDPPDPTVNQVQQTDETNVTPAVISFQVDEDDPIIAPVTGTAGIPNSELIGPLAPAVDQTPVLDAQDQTIVDIIRDENGNITDFTTRNVPVASIEPGRVSFEVGEDDPIVPPVFDGADVETIVRPFSTADDPGAVDLDQQNASFQNQVPAEFVPRSPDADPTAIDPVDLDAQTGVGPGNLVGAEASSVNGLLNTTRLGGSIRETQQPLANGDWRVRLRIAPGAGYLYADASNELMAPLRKTQGLLFPYTPRIDIAYQAEYTQYRPTHSNYKSYFYQGSSVGEINLTCDFTAQDTEEANYLLAAITYLKAASKMFYGNDPNRGSPPPLLRLTGLGTFQFNEHPVVISQFNYNLPDDVDYIKANAAQISSQSNILQGRRSLVPVGPTWAGSTIRRFINNLTEGAQANTLPGTSTLRANNQNVTYVPTKMSINLQLLPVATRREQSTQFSFKGYADGNLIGRGFW